MSRLTGNLLYIARGITQAMPGVMPLLSNKTRYMLAVRAEYKTQAYMEGVIERLVTSLYNGHIGGDFIDIMASLIQGQLTGAYQQAMDDEGLEGAMPDYLASSLEGMILGQFDFVDGYYRDIVDARFDGAPIEPLLDRAALWAARWQEAYNEAVRLITMESGGNMIWVLGATEVHCETCAALDGKVARASEWDALGLHPQGAPNSKLECGGWRCDCSLLPTDQRRTRDAYGLLEEITL